MNLSILKTAAFWMTAIPVIAGLLVSQNIVLGGSTVDHVIGFIVSLLGVLGGHAMAAPKALPAA